MPRNAELELSVASNGAYVSLSRVVPPEEMYCWGRDDIDARKAWALSEKLVGQKFDF